MKYFISTILFFIITNFSIAANAQNKYVGMQFDTGIPDGMALGINIKPNVKWLHMNLSGTYNILSPGVRGGITLDPLKFPIAPTFTLEGGHYFEGKIPSKEIKISYNYFNLQPGLEFGNRDSFRVFFRGGVSWINMNISNLSSALESNSDTIIGDASIKMKIVPTAKLGFLIFF